MNTDRNRAPVKRRLVLLANSLGPITLVDGADPVTVPAVYAEPPDTATETCIYFGASGPVDGESAPSAIGTANPSEDVYVVRGTVDVYGLDTAEAAEEAAERIVRAYDALLSRCQQLIDPTGAVPNGFDPSDPCPYWAEKAYLTATSLLSGRSEGNTYGGRYEIAIACTSNLR